MRPSVRLALAAALLASAVAAADPYDFRVYKLGTLGNPTKPVDPVANANFRAFVREFGAALTSVNLSPPETLGHAGFTINAELSVVGFDQTRVDIPTSQFSGDNGISGSLLLPSVHVRKGLPFSFELGTRVAWVEKSRMAAVTGELKWALNEGFALLPDVGLRAHVTRLLNTKDFDLTVAGVDLGVGKQFPIGGMVTLTPYAGWNLVWVAASSNHVDFNPGRSQAEGYCGTAAECDPNAQLTEGAGVFEEVPLGENSHSRFYGGVRFIAGALQLGAELSTSLLPSIPVEGAEDRELPAVTAYSFTIGLDF